MIKSPYEKEMQDKEENFIKRRAKWFLNTSIKIREDMGQEVTEEEVKMFASGLIAGVMTLSEVKELEKEENDKVVTEIEEAVEEIIRKYKKRK